MNHKDEAVNQHIYIQTLSQLRERQEQTLERMLVHLSQVLKSAIVDQEMLQQEGIIINIRLPKWAEYIQPQLYSYMSKYRMQLLLIYIMLRESMSRNVLNLSSLVLAIDEMLYGESGLCFIGQEDIAYLYIICSIFMPTFLKIMQSQLLSQPIPSNCVNGSAICYSLNFKDLNSVYLNQERFQSQILERPLRILRNFPTLFDYDFYQKNHLTDLIDEPNCIVSSSIVSREYIDLIQTFNCAKVIKFSQFLQNRPLTNNALLNSVQRLSILDFLSSSSSSKESQLPSKAFCLTFSISKRHFLKMRPFFQSLPPQMAPLTKYDILSYGAGQEFKTLLYRIATEDYWEHCPHSQFMQVYYLVNEPYVEWISIPAHEYKAMDKGTKFWSQQEMQHFCGNASRGVQKKGEFVIVGQGHEHFWRVREGCGSAVLIKWSLLLKSQSQILKYVNIVQSRQKQRLLDGWRLHFPHRRLILGFVSHEYLNLDVPIVRKLVHLIKLSAKSEENQLSKICKQFQRQMLLKKSAIPCKYRLCGLCGKEIINLCALLKNNVVCLWCLPNELQNTDKSFKFYVNYMCRPSSLQAFLKHLQSSDNQLLNARQSQIGQLYEQVFCEGDFIGSHQSSSCSGQRIRSSECFQNHFCSHISNLQLHIFLRGSYLCSIQSAIKCYALRPCKNKEESTQMKHIMAMIARSCLSCEERKKIREQIYCHYLHSNYVLQALSALGDNLPDQ